MKSPVFTNHSQLVKSPDFNSYDSQRCDGLLSDENASETESSQGTAQIAEDLPIIGLFLSTLKRS